jgi:two-component system, sensor histidine kinase and response regulator
MKKILLIDDDEGFREVISIVLKNSGYEVLAAADGLAGVKLARTRRPDLVISDIVMEPVDGFMTLSIMRQQAATTRIPFILVTGCEHQEGARKGLVMGADEYLTKPFSGKELVDTVRNLLQKRDEALALAAEQVRKLRDCLQQPMNEDVSDLLNDIAGSAAQIAANPDPAVKRLGGRVFKRTLKLRRAIGNTQLLGLIDSTARNPDALDVLRQAESCLGGDVFRSEADSVAKRLQRSSDLQIKVSSGNLNIGSAAIARIAEELCETAFQSTPPGTAVRIGSAASETDVMFTLEYKRQDRMEQTSFLSADDIENSAPSGGASLSLAVARRLTELHGGKLSKTRRSDGTVTIHVDLPKATGLTELN